MAIKKEIFKNLQAHLKNKLQNLPNNLPNLLWVDYNKGQFSSPQDSLGLPLPGILISFPSTTWLDAGRGAQEGDLTIEVQLGFENYAQAHTNSIDLDMALQYLEYAELVHTTLQSYRPPNCNGLSRIEDKDVEDAAGGMLITSIIYRCTVTDTSAHTEANYTEVNGVNPIPKHANPLTGNNNNQTQESWVIS